MIFCPQICFFLNCNLLFKMINVMRCHVCPPSHRANTKFYFSNYRPNFIKINHRLSRFMVGQLRKMGNADCFNFLKNYLVPFSQENTSFSKRKNSRHPVFLSKNILSIEREGKCYIESCLWVRGGRIPTNTIEVAELSMGFETSKVWML